MKKALFPIIVLALALLVSFTIPAGPAVAQEDDPWVCLESLGPGTTLTLTIDAQVLDMGVWVGLFHLRVDGELHDGWCVDPEMPIDVGWCFNASLLDKPRETPWCEIGYIMANYSPTSDIEAAAIQLAIWKYVKGEKDKITTTDSVVEARACGIYDDAEGECLTEPQWLVVIYPTEEHEGEAIQETIILRTKPPVVGGDVWPINKVACSSSLARLSAALNWGHDLA